MKKKSFITFSLAFSLMLSLLSCGSGGQSPADIDMAMWKQIQKGNYEQATDLWLKNLSGGDDAERKAKKEQMEASSKEFVKKMEQTYEEKGGLKEVELIEEKIDETGEKAKVTVKLTYGDGTTDEQENRYVKENGKWKIDISVK